MWLLTRNLFVFLFVGCGRFPGVPAPDPLRRAALEQAERDERAAAPAGWPSDSDCDLALWAGEARSAGLTDVVMWHALSPEGRPLRKERMDCGPAPWGSGDSAATTSTDMQLGIIEGLLADRDLPALTLLESYVDAHGGWAGFPDDLAHAPLTYMKPGTRALLAKAIRSLGGSPKGVWAYEPIPHATPGTDSDLHILLVSLAAERQAGAWGPLAQAAASDACIRNPTDAAAQAVCGHADLASELVLSPTWEPPSYVRGDPAYRHVHKLWILHYLLQEGRLDK